jgi:hypothetical protein
MRWPEEDVLEIKQGSSGPDDDKLVIATEAVNSYYRKDSS